MKINVLTSVLLQKWCRRRFFVVVKNRAYPWGAPFTLFFEKRLIKMKIHVLTSVLLRKWCRRHFFSATILYRKLPTKSYPKITQNVTKRLQSDFINELGRFAPHFCRFFVAAFWQLIRLATNFVKYSSMNDWRWPLPRPRQAGGTASRS